METNFVEQTDQDHSVRFYKFANDMERVSEAQESISRCRDHTNLIRRYRAFERAEYKKLISFIHENRKNIKILAIGCNKFFGVWKVSDTEYRLVVCMRHPNDEPNWKFMKSLMAQRFQDPKQHDVITTQNYSIFSKHFLDLYL
jgi:L-rhamnose mutarotase